MNRAFLASFALGVLACNTAPKPTCNVVTNSLISAGTPPASGVLISIPSGGVDGSLEICATDCTDRGQAECTQGSRCVSGEPLIQNSVCVLVCGTDDAGNDAGSCPSPLACSDAGVCTCLIDGGCL